MDECSPLPASGTTRAAAGAYTMVSPLPRAWQILLATSYYGIQLKNQELSLDKTLDNIGGNGPIRCSSPLKEGGQWEWHI